MGKPSAAVGAGVKLFGNDTDQQQMNTAATGINKGLDFQANLVRRAITGKPDYNSQMTELRRRIPGVTPLYNWLGRPNPAVGPNLGPLEAPVQGAARMLNHAAQGLIDAAISQPLDPLNIEAPAIGKLMGKMTPFMLRVMAADPTEITPAIHDALQWGAEAQRAGHDIPTIRGAANEAAKKGSFIQQHIMERVHNIINGQAIETVQGRVRPGTMLDDPERVNVGKALNGEVDPKTLTPREQSAYGQLRALTQLDLKTRRQAALDVAMNSMPDIKNLSQADKNALRQAFASGKEPVIPEPGPSVRTAYGENMPRSRSTYAAPQEAFVEVGGKQTRNRLSVMFDQAVKDLHLNDWDQRTLNQALHDDDVFHGMTDPEMRQRAAQMREAIQQDLAGRPVSTKNLSEAPRFKVEPKNKSEIDHMTMLRQKYLQLQGQLIKDVPEREHYMPTAHVGEREGRPGFTASKIQHNDPRNLQRDDIIVTHPQQLMDGFTAMAKNTGRQVETSTLHNILGDVLDDPKVAKMFDDVVPATGDARTRTEKWKDWWTTAIGYPRAGIVSLTPRHVSNIYDLAVNTVPPDKLPEFTARMSALVKQLMVANPRQYRELIKDMPGAVGGDFAERKPFFQHFPDWAPKIGGKEVPGLAPWSRFNNKLVWAFDAAAKITYGKMMTEAEGLMREEPNLWRYQTAAGEHEVSPRGGSFFFRSPNYSPGDFLGASKAYGGANRVEAVQSGKNVLNLGRSNADMEDMSNLNDAALEHFGQDKFRMMSHSAETNSFDFPHPDTAGPYLQKAGYSEEEAQKIMDFAMQKGKEAYKPAVGNAHGDFDRMAYANVINDAAVAKHARKAGYDAIQTPVEYFSLEGGAATPTKAAQAANFKTKLRAGGLAAERLVDYSNLAPIQKMLRYVAPFGTFRGGIPQAVGGGIARNIPRAAFWNRATGQAMYGGKPEKSGDPGLEFFNPTADVGRATTIMPTGSVPFVPSGLFDYARGTIQGAPATAISTIEDIAAPGARYPYKDFATYGQPALPNVSYQGKPDIGALASYALSGAPGSQFAQAALTAMGISRFQWRGIANETTRQLGGFSYTPPVPQTPSPQALPPP